MLDVDFDVLLNAPDDVMSSRSIAMVNWNRVLLYRSGASSRDTFFKPSIQLPPGWEYATALRDGARTGNRVDFAVTSLEMFVDSPLDLGRYVKKWDLWKDGTAFVQLDAFADYPQDLEIPESLLRAYDRMPAEAFAMYGSRHFIDYHALLALSDAIGFEGIEHHQSSDDRAPDDFLTDADESLAAGDLITHEFSHSWNGKYRRPADLTTPNFQVPMKTDLLWVYEGMNQYLGDLLSFRCGIREPKKYPEYLATIYADMDTESGRTTTPLIDLTTGAPYYYEARGSYGSIRRNANDFYTEGELVWLDADTIIRARSHNARSLDTFLHRFTEPSTTGPMVVTYTREQVETLLNGVEPYDWHAFFEKYVYQTDLHPPSDELERAGWKLVYTPKPNEFIEAEASSSRAIHGWYSYGANISEKGSIADVRVDSPAWKAGLVPGMTILAVNGQAVFARRTGVRGKKCPAFERADLADRQTKRLVSNAFAELSRGHPLPASGADRRHARHARRHRRAACQVKVICVTLSGGAQARSRRAAGLWTCEGWRQSLVRPVKRGATRSIREFSSLGKHSMKSSDEHTTIVRSDQIFESSDLDGK